MSSYEYYEFQAIDRRLGETEMEELRDYSSRAQITPTSFANEYSYGSFKGNADLWMEQYFDAYLYLAKWGTNQLQLRIPSRSLSAGTASQYCPGNSAEVREKSGYLIFKFTSDEEGGDWIQADGMLLSILPVRDELMRGDLRALYMGWLQCAQQRELDEDVIEPPVPPNLGDLSESLEHFAELLRLDPDLLDAAAEKSPIQKVEPMDSVGLRTWVAALPTEEKDALLIRLIEAKEAHLGVELVARYRRDTAPLLVMGPGGRTVRELLAAGQAQEKKRLIQEAQQAELEKAERERAQAIARELHLQSVAKDVPKIWRQVEALLAPHQSKLYAAAVQHIADLSEVAIRQGKYADFDKRLSALRTKHSSKRSFLARLSQAGL